MFSNDSMWVHVKLGFFCTVKLKLKLQTFLFIVLETLGE